MKCGNAGKLQDNGYIDETVLKNSPFNLYKEHKERLPSYGHLTSRLSSASFKGGHRRTMKNRAKRFWVVRAKFCLSVFARETNRTLLLGVR